MIFMFFGIILCCLALTVLLTGLFREAGDADSSIGCEVLGGLATLLAGLIMFGLGYNQMFKVL